MYEQDTLGIKPYIRNHSEQGKDIKNFKKFGAIGYLLAGINSLLSYNTSKFRISKCF